LLSSAALDDESKFMLLERDERTTTELDERTHLEEVAARTNSVVLVADDRHELIGYVGATGGVFRRNHSTAYVVIGVRRAHRGRGIGS
jgi:GNAT superfamily N-acetyltransferase